jgi:hypothetical protein
VKRASFLATFSIIALTGCSTFNKEWKAATAVPPPANSIEGPWIGEWRSDKNGHHGALRCVVSKTSDTAYRAHYRAKFWKIFRFTYIATLNGRETNGITKLQGQANLGKLAGGIYKYDATVTSTQFQSSYSSKYDHGKFQMLRPQTER